MDTDPDNLTPSQSQHRRLRSPDTSGDRHRDSM